MAGLAGQGNRRGTPRRLGGDERMGLSTKGEFQIRNPTSRFRKAGSVYSISTKSVVTGGTSAETNSRTAMRTMAEIMLLPFLLFTIPALLLFSGEIFFINLFFTYRPVLKVFSFSFPVFTFKSFSLCFLLRKVFSIIKFDCELFNSSLQSRNVILNLLLGCFWFPKCFQPVEYRSEHCFLLV